MLNRIRPHWRKMTWVLIVWSALILLWAVTVPGRTDCGAEVGRLSRESCEAGAGIGIALILFIGFIGFVFFSLIWFMTRPKGRECPACGMDVKRGLTACPSCRYDFVAAAAP